MKKTFTYIGLIASLAMTTQLAFAMKPDAQQNHGALAQPQTSHSMHVDSKPAPGKGIIDAVYPHYKQEPSFYDFDGMPLQTITKDISRRFVMGTHTTVQEWHVKAGAKLPLHYHLNEAVINTKKGRFTAYSQGKEYTLMPGKILVIPPFVPHEFVALEDSILVGFVSPARADFLGDLAAAPDPSTAANKLLRAR